MIRIYVAMPEEIVILEGEHPHWRAKVRFQEQARLPVPVPEPGKARFVPKSAYPQSIAIDPHHPERVYCGTFGQGLWRSDDGGDTWQRVGKGITEPKVMAVAVSALDIRGEYGVVWAGTEPSRVFRSEDGGETFAECVALQEMPSRPKWTFPPRPYTHHVRVIQLDPHNADRLFVAVHEGGIIRSEDGGRTFIDYDPTSEFDPHGVAMHPLAPGRLYESAGGDEKTARFQPKLQFGVPPFVPRLVITRGGYAETHDGGKTWQKRAAGLEKNHYLWEIAVDPADPDTMIASAAVGPIQAHSAAFAESYIVRRTGDSPWQRVETGLPSAKGSMIYDLASNAQEPGVFYAVNNRGVFRSGDAGQSWTRLNVDWERFHDQHSCDLVVVTV